MSDIFFRQTSQKQRRSGDVCTDARARARAVSVRLFISHLPHWRTGIYYFIDDYNVYTKRTPARVEQSNSRYPLAAWCFAGGFADNVAADIIHNKRKRFT